MFTGIVAGTGTLQSAEPQAGGERLWVCLPTDAACGKGEDWGDLEIGESIAIDGCCLTLVEVERSKNRVSLAFDVIEETLRLTNLGERKEGDELNLERALRLGDRLGGHYVSGHVDTTAPIVAIQSDEDETRITVEIPSAAPCRVIHKGSITIDGVSLTVAAVDGAQFTVALIPHTLEVTNLSDRSVGDRVHLEMDQIGRWVESILLSSGLLSSGHASNPATSPDRGTNPA